MLLMDEPHQERTNSLDIECYGEYDHNIILDYNFIIHYLSRYSASYDDDNRPDDVHNFSNVFFLILIVLDLEISTIQLIFQIVIMLRGVQVSR